ncbi:MAG TPA: glutaredoxin domain-containing protein [Roseiflexaceae bacterium]|nr:glutaredoxin domain-containing protein [Roseiflexaceae bacterium]
MTTQSGGDITVFGTTWCGDCRVARRVLDQHRIAYRYIDIEHDEEARSYVVQVNRGFQSVPTIVFPDGSVLVEPSAMTLTQKLSQLGRA